MAMPDERVCVVYWYPFSNPHTLWPSIATRPAIFTICHVFLKYLYTNKTHSLNRQVQVRER